MKKFLIIILLLAPTAVFAQEAAPTLASLPDPLVMLKWLVEMLSTQFPSVGKVLAHVLMYALVLPQLLTALALAVEGVSKALQAFGKGAGLHALADKIKLWGDKLYKWVGFFSTLNIQKK